MFNVSEYEGLRKAFKFIQAPIGLIGIVCNILAILVFQRKQLKMYSYSFYWKCLACFENLILLHTFRHWTRNFLNFDIDLITPFFCRFNEYQPFVFGTAAICVESLITLDRFLTIIYGKRFNILNQRSFRFVSISAIIIYSLLVNISLPLNYQLEISNGTLACFVPVETFKQISTIVMINVLFLNLFINSFLDFSIIYHIIWTRKNTRMINRSSIIERQFAISAITINVTSLLFKLPFIFGNFLTTYFNLSSEIIEFIFQISMTISLFNQSEMLFIHLIVNSTFRREFRSIFQFRSNNNNNISNLVIRRNIFEASQSPDTIAQLKRLNCQITYK